MEVASDLLLDTHTWIWLRFGTLTAKPEVMAQLRNAADRERWFLSAFTFYEIAHAASRGRLRLDMPVLDWMRGPSSRGAPRVLELTPEVAASASALPSTFHGDPGDRIVAATAITYKLTICTHDDLLLRFAKTGLFKALRVKETKVSDSKETDVE